MVSSLAALVSTYKMPLQQVENSLVLVQGGSAEPMPIGEHFQRRNWIKLTQPTYEDL